MAWNRVMSRDAAAADMCSEGCFSVEASSTALRNNKRTELCTQQPRTCAARAALNVDASLSPLRNKNIVKAAATDTWHKISSTALRI